MKLLKIGSGGNEVKDWQYFLIGLGYYKGKADGLFKSKTKTATEAFQTDHGLDSDGIVGRNTTITAIKMGCFSAFASNYPDRPPFKPILNLEIKNDLFGEFEFKHTPTDSNPEKVEILGDWRKENIVKVDLPQLAKATDGKYTSMYFNKKAEYQLKQFFIELEEEGLLNYIVTYAGAYTARFIRGSRKHLSNHSWGTAFDINAGWNGLGREPATEHEIGTVFQIVPIAIKWGFYWGGHFRRKDGMHFEVARIINEK